MTTTSRQWDLDHPERAREHRREAARRFRAAHPERARAAALKGQKALRDRRRQEMDDIKRASGCVDCRDVADPNLLHFHHVDPATKTFTIADGLGNTRAAIDRELAKCVVLCRPCHEERHRQLRSDAKGETDVVR